MIKQITLIREAEICFEPDALDISPDPKDGKEDVMNFYLPILFDPDEKFQLQVRDDPDTLLNLYITMDTSKELSLLAVIYNGKKEICDEVEMLSGQKEIFSKKIKDYLQKYPL